LKSIANTIDILTSIVKNKTNREKKSQPASSLICNHKFFIENTVVAVFIM